MDPVSTALPVMASLLPVPPAVLVLPVELVVVATAVSTVTLVPALRTVTRRSTRSWVMPPLPLLRVRRMPCKFLLEELDN